MYIYEILDNLSIPTVHSLLLVKSIIILKEIKAAYVLSCDLT